MQLFLRLRALNIHRLKRIRIISLTFSKYRITHAGSNSGEQTFLTVLQLS